MPDSLPLLVFPKKRDVAPPPGIPRPISQPHKPEKPRQIERIKNQISEVNLNFGRYQAEVAAGVAGLEPEVVLVLEVAGSIADFRQAVEAARLEWLGEWDVDEIAPDDDFYELNTRGERTEKPLKGRLFLSMANAAGMQELLTLWAHWENGRKLPMGKGKWADVFSQLLKIRRWDIEETLGESGMLALWETITQPLQPDDPVTFQIELFYRASPLKRQQNQAAATAMIVALGGAVLGNSLDIEEIAFHALKASLPAYRIQELLAEVRNGNVGIALFKFSGVMYFRPTGQSLAILDSDEGFEADPKELEPVQALPPVTALLDGAPLQLHQDLQDRVIVDDIFGLEALYQPGERKHGTSMASLIVSGDHNSGEPDPLLRPIYCIPVMQPDPKSRDRREHMPDDVFFEDRIWIAVKRMFEGGKNVPPQAPDIKIINLSIGDELRPFIHEPSPWSRLIDWLSWKYKVLFCISAGNVYESLDLGMNYDAFSALDASERRKVAIKAIAQTLSYRRVLSPAESLNAITVGASNTDDFKDAFPELRRFDLLDAEGYFSPVSRVGHGFKRTIKPEVLFPGGRQLFRIPDMRRNTNYEIDTSKAAPGQSVAWDSTTAGKLNARVFTRGTSNSSALATRAASKIHEMLMRLREQEGENIPDSLTAVMIKALLVHGARQSESVKDELTGALKTARNGRQFKEVVARYMGYGTPNIPRVLECAEHRATIVGGAEIKQDQIHEYEFPLPIGLASQPLWRCLIITLAWFSPVNPKHRNLREAKLQFSPSGTKWEESDLKLKRCDGDWMQVMRGTVQHEVLEGDNLISAYQDGAVLRLKVECKKDATERLDEFIPYAIAVTLEVKEGVDIPIYQQIRAKIKPQIPLRAA